MPRDLISLIRACGYAGTSGQSFRNNVRGAVSGSRMSYYILDGWGNWTSDYAGGTLAYNAFINLTYLMNGRSLWTNIRNNLTVLANDGTDPTSTGSASITSGATPNAGSNSLQVQVRGGTKIIQLHRVFTGINKQWSDYGTEPNPNPVTVASDIQITANFTSNGSETPDAYTYDLHIHYPGDGDFNPPLDYSFPITVMGTVSVDSTAAVVEWYSDSGYTTLYDEGTSGQTRVTSGGSGPTSGSLWMRYKDNGSWVNYGQVDWFDPRVYGHF